MNRNVLRQSPSHRFCFTMIELVVAIAVLMIVFVTAATSLIAIQRAWSKASEHSDHLKNLIMIDKVVNANFRNIIPFKWKDDQFHVRQIFLGDSDRIVFACTHRVNDVREGGIRFMSISLEDHSLVVKYRNIPMLYWDEKTMEGESEVLADGIESIQFIYGDLNRKREVEWLDEWDEDAEKSIPMAIQMRINWQDGTYNVWLRRTAGASKRTNFGKKVYSDRTLGSGG